MQVRYFIYSLFQSTVNTSISTNNVLTHVKYAEDSSLSHFNFKFQLAMLIFMAIFVRFYLFPYNS